MKKDAKSQISLDAFSEHNFRSEGGEAPATTGLIAHLLNRVLLIKLQTSVV